MAQIPESVIEEILNKADIESVVGKYVSFTKRTGQNLFGLCPFHSEKTPSFSVSLNKNIYHCFGCGKGGNSIRFIMDLEHLTYPEAIRFLGNQYGVEVPEYSGSGNNENLKNRKKRVTELLNEAGKYYYKCFSEPSGKAARDYAKGRELSRDTLTAFGIGYAPDAWDSLYLHLRNKGYTDDEMKDCGLFTISKKTNRLIDLFRGRLVFPIFDAFGKIIAFGGRSLGPEMPKYVNSPDSLVYKKQEHLYALNYAKAARSEQLIIVEGYMDAISMHQAGIKNTVASLGTAFTDSQLRLAAKYAKEIVFFFDSDKAGRNAAIRAVRMMLAFLKKMSGIKIRIKIAAVPDGKDPDEYIKHNGADSFRAVVNAAKDVDDYLFSRAFDDSCDENGKLDTYKFQDDVITYGSWLFDDLKREKMATNAASYLGANAQTVLNRMNDLMESEENRQYEMNLRAQKRAEQEDLKERMRNQGGYQDDYSDNDYDVDDNNSWTWDDTETEQENDNIWWGVSEEVIGEKTLYNNPNADSWHNIVRAAEMVDGAEIANGEEFSMYNQFPNQAGEADGMVESEYFIDENRKGRTFGSGICFFGTTSAQAVDEAADEGLKITERHPHVQDVGYAIRGVNDAALNFAVDPANRQDLKILNETGSTVRLNYYVDSAVGALTCTITKLGEFLKS